jgi:RHS repeat-associated protein
MMLLRGRITGSAPNGRMRVRSLVFSAFALVACFACAGAHAQELAPSSMTFACTPDPIYVGASATCRTHLVGYGYPVTGSVSLYLGSNLLQTIPLDSNGDAVVTTAAFGPGPGIYVITGVYSGDGNYLPTQRDMALTVYSGQVIVTAETLVCFPYFAYAGNPISCKMHLPAGTTGTVGFTVAGNAWATATVNQDGDAVAMNGLQGAAVGDYRITATYSGDTNFAPTTASTTAVVTSFKPQPNVISVGCSPSPLVVGNSGSCTVQVGGGATGNVDLYVHDQYLTTVPLSSSGTATVSNVFGTLSAGSYGVRAVYTGDANFDYASAATTININTGTQTPTLAISCNPAALSPGNEASCTAQAQAGATGYIQFFIGGTSWTSAPLDATGRATASPSINKDEWDLSFLPVGSYSVVAYYPGDQNFATASAGVTMSIQVTKPAPSISVFCNPTVLVSGSVATCTASVGQGATGAVLFGLPGQPTSGLTLDANGNVIFENQLPGAPIGSYTLQASYLGDINFAPAAATATVNVSSQLSTPTITASISPSVIRNGGSVTVNGNVSGGATGTVDLSTGAGHFVTMPVASDGSFGAAAHVSTPGDGLWSVELTYSGDANYVSVTKTLLITAVTPPLNLNCSPTTLSSGGSASCTAQVAGATSGTVSVYVDGALQGTSGVDQSGTVVITIPPTSLPLGTRNVTASYFMADQTPSGTASQSISVTSGSTQPPGYSYSITDLNSNSGYATNGNVLTYTDSVNGQWTLGYDSVNRLISAATGGQNICWTYDSFGNRTAQTLPSTTACGSSVSTVQYPNNQDPSLLYDASGDVANDGINQYLYDAEGRICAVKYPAMGGAPPAMMHYLYDAEGRRVAKGTITVWSCETGISNNFSENEGYMIGPSGEQLTEVDGQGNLVHTNVFANGHLIATYDPQNVYFHLSDWLGTRRATADYLGNIEFTYYSLPFGEMIPQNQSLGVTEHFFTGKERDTESGLDNFGARYYSSATGRFMSPDWSAKAEPVPYASLHNPQTLNLYGYVNNNPLSAIDESGHSAGVFTLLGESSIMDAEINEYQQQVQRDQSDQPAQQQNSSGGGGFWHHVSNLFHGHSWNFVRTTVAVTETDTVREPIEAVTAATDAAGIAGLAASEKIAKPLGRLGAAASIMNDPSPKNITTNFLGLLPGFDGPMAITTTFNDFLTYGANNSTPGPKKASGSDQLTPTLPTQDGGCLAAGLPSC